MTPWPKALDQRIRESMALDLPPLMRAEVAVAHIRKHIEREVAKGLVRT